MSVKLPVIAGTKISFRLTAQALALGLTAVMRMKYAAAIVCAAAAG